MIKVMLDTYFCIDVMRRRAFETRRRLERSKAGEVTVSSILAAELWTGAFKSHESERADRAIREFLDYVTVLDGPAQAALVYGQLCTRLQQSGRMIGDNGPADCGPCSP